MIRVAALLLLAAGPAASWTHRSLELAYDPRSGRWPGSATSAPGAPRHTPMTLLQGLRRADRSAREREPAAVLGSPPHAEQQGTPGRRPPHPRRLAGHPDQPRPGRGGDRRRLGAWRRCVTRVLRRLRERAGRSARALYVLEKLAGYIIIVLGVFVGLSTAGLNLSSLAVFAGALGVGVGLGLQGVVKEFVSGLFLIFDRMLDIGDYIELDDGARGVIAGDRPARHAHPHQRQRQHPGPQLPPDRGPGHQLDAEGRHPAHPHPLLGRLRRRPRQGARGGAGRAGASPFTLPETETRKSQVWLVGFGESGLNFELLVWPTPGRGQAPRRHARRLHLVHRRRPGRGRHRGALSRRPTCASAACSAARATRRWRRWAWRPRRPAPQARGPASAPSPAPTTPNRTCCTLPNRSASPTPTKPGKPGRLARGVARPAVTDLEGVRVPRGCC